MTETWSVSPSVDMLPFGVTVPATVPQRSAIPEGLMNYSVYSPKEEIVIERNLINSYTMWAN
jgi:hypothetical protein